MYKAELQELCQKKKWGLPKYSCVKNGPDHDPSFKASVVVKGVTFDTTTVSKSSKAAQNDAARLAAHHFAASEPGGETKTERPGTENIQAGELQSNTKEFKNDEINQYKLMLQTYLQRNKLVMPVYKSDKKGPPHAPCFKATVFVEGHPYESLGSYKTLKEAEHAAAQVALLSLTAKTFQENGSPPYKNILQELAESEGFNLPIYKTESSGEPHDLSFTSTVKVEGEAFQGTTAKSKKQAEFNAARAAYIALKERKRSRTGNSSSSSLAYKALEVMSGSVFLTFLNAHGKCESDCPQHLTQNANYRKQCIQEKDDYEVCPTESFPEYSKYSSQKFIESLASADMDNTTGNRDSYPEILWLVPSSIITPPDLSSLSIGGPDLKKYNGTESYLLCNRFRVYTSIPDIVDFPKDTILLPIAEGQWVAVSLEFPN